MIIIIICGGPPDRGVPGRHVERHARPVAAVEAAEPLPPEDPAELLRGAAALGGDHLALAHLQIDNNDNIGQTSAI